MRPAKRAEPRSTGRRGARLLALAALLSLAACGGPNAPAPSAAPAAALPEGRPAALVATPPDAPPPVHVARVRLYADLDHRAQVLQWERAIARRLERASAILEPSIGLRLELAEALHWDRRGAEDLEQVLRELEERDPAVEVELVVGLVDTPPAATDSFVELALARPLGHHLVLRTLDRGRQREALRAAHPNLDAAALDALADEHHRHRSTVLLLHGLGHALGAPHVTEPGRLLRARYDAQLSSYGEATASVLRAVLPHWGDEERDRAAAAAAARAVLASGEGEGWVEDERQALLVAYAAPLGQQRGWTPPPLGPDLRAADRDVYATATRFARSAQPEEGWSRLEPLTELYPDDPAVALLACRLAAVRAADDAVARCEHAREVSEGHLAASVHLGQALLAAGAAERAVRVLAEAETTLRQLGVAEPEAWRVIAEAYRETRRVSDAERAAAELGEEGAAIRAWAASTRARFALPADAARFGIRAADEPGYLARLEAALEDVYAGRWKQARAAVAELDRRFAGAPGVLLLRCEVAFRRKQLAAARAACAAATERAPGASWPPYLLGLLAERAGERARASELLERAIELDPTLEHAYRALGRLYRGRDAAALERLGSRYQDRFGKALPER